MLRLVLFAVVAILSLPMPVSAQHRPVSVGTLECGAISKRPNQPGLEKLFDLVKPPAGDVLKCLFVPNKDDQPQQIYLLRPQFPRRVEIDQFTRVEWTVHAGIEMSVAILSGGYSGGLEEMPVASGLGNNLFVGGIDNMIVLQPRQVPSNNPPNLASAIAVLELEFVGCHPESEGCS